MNFSERCIRVSYLLENLRNTVDSLDKDASELEVARDDTNLLTRMVQGFLVCNRLSREILYEQIPHIEQEEHAVGDALRLAHDELMKRARGAHTDMEIYTKTRTRRRAAVVPIRHAV